MPGIVGLITKMPPQQAVRQLAVMVESICHEPFYRTGTVVDEGLGVYVGWAAIERSFGDGMPLRNQRGDVVLVFSGEEYSSSDPASPNNGRRGGADVAGPSYLVRRYEEEPEFPASLNGLFHGLVVDRRRGVSSLFVDRYGMHRLCYHQSQEAFYFAAEAKAILAVRPELRSADPHSLGEVVACACVLQDRTIFKDVKTMPGAAFWSFQNGSIQQKKTYFQPAEWESQPPLDPESYYQVLRGVLDGSISRYFNGHAPVGMTVTGGLDTRVIMAWEKPRPGSLPCYTFGGMFRDCQDVEVARRVAKLCGQSHQVITVGHEFLTRFPHYAERSVQLTEGGVDVSRSSDLYVSEKARAIAPVKVVGTYGSEIIRHVVTLKAASVRPDIYGSDFVPFLAQAAKTATEVKREHPVTFAAFRQSPWHHHGVLALEQSQLTVRSPFLDNDFVKTVFRSPATHNGSEDVRLRLVRDGNSALAQLRTDQGVGGSSGRLASAVVRRFLDFTTKSEYAYDYGMPQWLARIDHFAARLHFERLFLGRHKLLHYRIWYRDALSEYVRQMLLDSKTLSRPYLNRAGVEALVCGHLKGNRNYTTEIHKLLTLELIHRRFFDTR